MRKRKSKLDQMASASVDMTPMIDVIFNLIIFFMIINRMVQDERAKLEVPVATQAEEEKSADKKRLILNVHKNGQIDVGSEVVVKAGDKEGTWSKLREILTKEAERSKSANGDVSEREILIRGDRRTKYEYIQKVLYECNKKKIYKISFAAIRE